MSFARWVCVAAALPFAGVGLFFLTSPDVAASLVGLELTNVTADNDVRGVYGGLSLGCAAFLASCSRREDAAQLGVRAVLLMFAGLVLGRCVSVALHGWPGPIGRVLHAAEAVGLVVALVAWRRGASGVVARGVANV